MQIKVTIPLDSIRVALKNKQPVTITSAGEDAGLFVGTQNSTACWKNHLAVSYKVKHVLIIQSSSPTPRYLLQRNEDSGL